MPSTRMPLENCANDVGDTFYIEGVERPALVADTLLMWLKDLA